MSFQILLRVGFLILRLIMGFEPSAHRKVLIQVSCFCYYLSVYLLAKRAEAGARPWEANVHSGPSVRTVGES